MANHGRGSGLSAVRCPRTWAEACPRWAGRWELRWPSPVHLPVITMKHLPPKERGETQKLWHVWQVPEKPIW